MTTATSITVRVPIAIRRRGGRKVIVTPDGVIARGAGAVQTRGDPALVKALARAHRWQRLLEGGRYRSLRELAAAEGVDRAFIGRMLQLTLLAPDIVEAILDGRQPADVSLPKLMEPFPGEWNDQQATLICGLPHWAGAPGAPGPGPDGSHSSLGTGAPSPPRRGRSSGTRQEL
jgi:hypothetical protein